MKAQTFTPVHLEHRPFTLSAAGLGRGAGAGAAPLRARRARARGELPHDHAPLHVQAHRAPGGAPGRGVTTVRAFPGVFKVFQGDVRTLSGVFGVSVAQDSKGVEEET